MSTSLVNRTDIHAPSISKVDQKRLERLAAIAERTPQAILRFVLRDGFVACEEDVAESLLADREFQQGANSSHASVMQAAQKRLIR